LAASAGHLKIVQLLLDNGVNIELQDVCENSALLLAAYEGHLEIIKLLLENGANIRPLA
jgi:ankyrin repeat protein